MTVIGFLKKLRIAPRRLIEYLYGREDEMLALGRLLSELVAMKGEVRSLSDVEFRVFSQFGDDGIIQWLINNINFRERSFIEFGVQDYRESNTRFLLMNNNWSGFVIDGSARNVQKIRSSSYYWKYSLRAEHLFIDEDNINDALTRSGLGANIGILHIDLDGVDYWIWKKIETIRPDVVILEYNSVFGLDRSITVPYSKNFVRNKVHYSNLYFGASLRAIYDLSVEKGYAFIGCNSAGNNAYFVLREHVVNNINELSLSEGYVISKFRESRNQDGTLNFIEGDARLKLISGLPVFNTKTGTIEML